MKNYFKFLFYASILSLAACGGDACDDVDCGTGTCVDGTCDCPDGYSGTNCETFDPCFSVDCGDNGTCADGTCECEDGYEGDFCETEVRSTFLGIWRSTDFSCDGGAPEDEAFLVEAGTDILDVTVRDPEDSSFALLGTIVDNTIIMPSQEIDNNGTLLNYEGTITLTAPNLVDISVSVMAAGISASCQGTASK